LTVFPKAGEVIPEVVSCEVRQILCKPYRILYRQLTDDLCRIVGVLHSARDFGAAFNPKDLDLSE
jgi:plasmid stabilization system protein ParE